MATKIYLDEDGDGKPDKIISCQGEPRCPFKGEERMIEQLDGCKWCSRLFIDEFGREVVIEPGEA